MSSFASDEWGGGSLCTPEKWEGAVNFNMDAINDKLRLQMQVIVAHVYTHEEIWGEWELRRLSRRVQNLFFTVEGNKYPW